MQIKELFDIHPLISSCTLIRFDATGTTLLQGSITSGGWLPGIRVTSTSGQTYEAVVLHPLWDAVYSSSNGWSGFLQGIPDIQSAFDAQNTTPIEKINSFWLNLRPLKVRSELLEAWNI